MTESDNSRAVRSGRQYETIAQCAKRLAITPNTVRRYIADGKLRTYGMSSRAIRLDAAEVDEAFTGSRRPLKERIAELDRQLELVMTTARGGDLAAIGRAIDLIDQKWDLIKGT